MSDIEAPAGRAAPPQPGRLQAAFRRLLMRRATVAAVEDIGPRFRLITLEGPELRDAKWAPGQKMQLAMGTGFATRTYTPIDWDERKGRTRLLGFIHGEAPGSEWLRGAGVGDPVDIFGPRGSIDAGGVTAPLALFGDETSIGVALALQAAVAGRLLSAQLEVQDVVAAQAVTRRLGLAEVAFHAVTAGDTHLAAMEATLAPLADDGATFVLTGRAPAIQRLRQALRGLGVPSGRVLTKAYWAPGKTGLD